MDKKIEDIAFQWAKKNRSRIVKWIISKYEHDNYKAKQIIFLSGSPWAWKTEFINWMLEKGFDDFFIHIDLDDLRVLIPNYSWEQADSYQKWAIKIMEMLLDKAFKKNLNIILDWTFWSKSATPRNIKRAYERWYDIKIYYIKFDPVLSWKFTLWRELENERKVPFWSFYKKYFSSFENIRNIYKKYDKIKLIVLKKYLTKSWHSSKIYKISTYSDFQRLTKEIEPEINKFILCLKMLYLTIKYRVLIKKGLISNDINYEQDNKKNK
jgi:hypothetical protein